MYPYNIDEILIFYYIWARPIRTSKLLLQFRLFMIIMMVYWFFHWCRYFGHCNVGLYYMQLGGMVSIVCIFCMGDEEKVIFMVNYDDGCDVVVLLGCQVGPMN